MIKFKEDIYNINLCRNIDEWATEFYGMPEGAIIENRFEMEKECMGFAEVTSNEIWIFVPKSYINSDLSETIAHEIGHCMDFPNNPNAEEQANHYQHFYKVVNDIFWRSQIYLNT